MDGLESVPSLEQLRKAAAAGGVHHLGCTSAEPFTATRETLLERRSQGLHGSMQFTYRNPERSTDPQRTLPGARSLLVGARSYHRHEPPPPEGRGPVARVARYVWADDQALLLSALEAVAEVLRSAGYRAVVISDQNHLVDRAAAHRAGLGWFGKNTNLLLPGAGSWFILGAVLTDAAVDEVERARLRDSDPVDRDQDGDGDPVDQEQVRDRDALDVVPDGCGSCTRCLPSCPTGAIVAPGVIDARRCLSWTLQTTGRFPVDQRVPLGDRLYGCDECQDACPPNRLEVRRVGPGGSGHLDEYGDPDRAWVPVLELLASTDEQIMAAHGRWYVAERKARYVRRNALVVLGNIGDGTDPRVRAVLARCLAAADPLVRAHAVWSARRLGCDDLLVDLLTDPDPDVQAELALAVPSASGATARP